MRLPARLRALARGARARAGMAALLLIASLAPRLAHPRGAMAGTGITMQVVPGFHGQVRSGAWLPLVVDLYDAGGDFQGSVVVPDEAAPPGLGGPQTLHNLYAVPVVLANGSHKRVILYVPAADAQGGSVDVRLVDAAGHTQLAQQISVQAVSAGTVMAGVVSADLAVARLLNGVGVNGTTLTSVALTPRDLVPEVAALRTFDLLVLSNAPTDALSPAQREALRSWVSGGGTLLVAGGPTIGRTLAGLPADLVPVRVTGTTTISSLTALSRLSGSAATGEAVTISTGRPRAGTVLAATGSSPGAAPLLVEAPLGRGHLLYLALDLALAPLNTLSPADPFWQTVLGHALGAATTQAATGSGPSTVSTMGTVYGMINVLNTLPAAALPPVGLFLALVALYVLVLGPVNFLVLRRLRRQELSWVTIPSVAILFCIGTFVVALQGRGSAVVLNNVSVVHLDGAASTTPHPYQTETYVGLFSPTRSDYRLSVPGSALPMALPSYGYSPNLSGNGGSGSALGLVFTQGEPTTVEFKNMSMWSLRGLILQNQTAIAGTIAARLHLDAGGGIAGTITNHTRLDLVDAALVTPGAALVIGTLHPSAASAVRLAPASGVSGGPPPLYQLYQGAAGISVMGAPVGTYAVKGRAPPPIARGGAPYPGSSAPSQDVQNYQQVLGTVFQNGDTSAVAPILFLAWNHAPLTPMTVNGEPPHRQDLNLLVQPLWLTLNPGPFTLPEGVVAPQLVDAGGGAQTGGGGLNVTAGNVATFLFAIPADGHTVAATTLSVNISTNGGPSAVDSSTGSLYDWVHHRWDTVDLSNGDLHLSGAGRYVSSQGLVRLRLSAPTNSNLYINNVGANVQIGAAGTIH